MLAQLAVTVALAGADVTVAQPPPIARGPRRDALALVRAGAARRDTIPMTRDPDDPDDGPSCPRGARLLRLPAIAIVGLAAPVAGIAALVAGHPMRAASGAMIGGAGYAAGVTVWLGARRDCHAGQALAYAATPLPAILGAVVAR